MENMQRASHPVKNPIRVLMLEDSEADAELILQELRRSNLSTVIGRVDSEEAFVLAVRSFVPDVVLSDHSMAQFDARVALTLLRRIRPATPLILVTGSLSPERTAAFLRAGAEDVIMKGNLGRLPAVIDDAVHLRRPLEKLTPRQIEVLRLVVDGYRTREIAMRLKLSVKTVESHRGEIMKRLGIHDIVGLVRYAFRIGLITLTSDSADMLRSGH
jgi:DNA-binding NarL/FixJ family response regulator